MIAVQVKLFATLRRYHPGLKIGQVLTVELPDGAPVARLLQELGLPAEEVRMVFVNGIVRERDHPLADGDELGLFPPVGGG